MFYFSVKHQSTTTFYINEIKELLKSNSVILSKNKANQIVKANLISFLSSI